MFIKLIINLQFRWRSIHFIDLFAVRLKFLRMCLSDNKWKYCALCNIYDIARHLLPRRRSSTLARREKKRERKRGRVRLFFTLLRATIGLSILGLGSNFSSLRRIITESFPRQAASSANQRLALPLLPPWRARRAMPPTRGLRSAERQWKMWCEEFAGVINGPAPLPRPSFLRRSWKRYVDCLGFPHSTATDCPGNCNRHRNYSFIILHKTYIIIENVL